MAAHRTSQFLVKLALGLVTLPLPSAWITSLDAQVVTPSNGSMSAYAGTGHQLVTFWVNNNTTQSIAFSLTCTPTGQVSSCTGPSSVFVPVGMTFPVNDTITTAGVGSGFVYLTAGTSTGQYSVTVVSGTPAVSVTPHGGVALPIAAQNTGGYKQTFTIKNTGTVSTWYMVHCGGAPNIACSYLTPDHYATVDDTVTLAAGASKVDTAYFAATSGGVGTLFVTATGDGIRDSGSYTVSVAGLVYHPSLSPASDGISYDHPTPSVGSMGTSRAVTLTYNSTAARPMALVALDVAGPTSPAPTGYELQVQVVGGSYLTLMNGSTAVYYSATAGVTSRLTAAIDAKANGLATGSYPVNVILTTTYPGPQTQTTTISSRIMVNDQTGSALGAGVGLAGVGRLYSMSGSYGRLLVDGAGAMEYFDRSCAGCAFTSPAGESGTLVAYDSANIDTLFRLKALDSSSVDFNRQGRLLRHRVLPSIQDLTFTWSDTLLTGITDASGRGFTLAYTSGSLVSITDFANRALSTTVAGGRLVRVSDPDGGKDSLIYNGNNLLTQLNGRSGGTWNYGYNALNQGDTLQAPSGPDYTGANVRPTITMQTAALVAWQPSVAGTTSGAPKGSVRPDTVYSVVTDPLGNTNKMQVDRFGMATKTIDPLGEVTNTAQDTLGNNVWLHDPSGHAKNATYSGYLLQTSHDSVSGQSWTYTYDASNRLETVQGGSVRLDYFYHDGTKGPAGALKLEYAGDTAAPGASPVGGVVVDSFFPNAYGQDTAVVDQKGHRSRWTYAVAASGGNVQQMTDAAGHVTAFHYNSYGLADTTTFVTGVKEATTYDTLDRVRATTNRLGYSTRYMYGSLGLTRVTDPKGQVYKFDLNPWGLVAAQHDLGDTTKFDSLKYDVGGELRSVITRRNDTLTLTYDALGRLRTRFSSDTAFPAESLSYGLLPSGGSWTVASNRNGRDSLAYDAAGHLLYALQTFPGDTTKYAMTYSYDTFGRLHNRSAPPHGTTAHFAFDPALGAVDSLCALGTCEAIKSDSELKPVKLTYGAGAWSHEILYDSLHEVTADTFSISQLQTDFKSSWVYDSLAHLTSDARGASPNVVTEKFAYDVEGQLTNACNQGIPTCSNEYLWTTGSAYQYDSAGNRADTAAHPTVGAGNRVTRFKNYAISYDANGAITQIAGLGTSGGWTSTDTTTLQWNAVGQLTRAEYWPAGGAHTVVKFRYDALGRRVGKSVNGVTTWFVYDGGQVEMDVDSTTRTMKAEYAFNRGLVGMRTPTDTLVAIDAPPVGTLLGLVRARDGAERKTYGVLARTPWSEATTDTGVVVRYRMGSQEYDQETGLYHMGARYYDPMLGRWLTEDPAGIASSTNLYSYAGNDPINAIDPSGLYTCEHYGNPQTPILHCHWTQQDCMDANDYNEFQNCGMAILIAYCESLGGFWDGTDCVFVVWDNSGNGPPPTSEGGESQQPKPPCNLAGNAPPPSAYADAAREASALTLPYAGPAALALDFHRGGRLDAQAQGAKPAYANYVFGVYFAAAGFGLSTTLSAANKYGQLFSHYPKTTKMDATYSHIPVSNVISITQGFNDQKAGTTCTTK